jgi:Tol biopolymer transport system component
VNADGSGQTRLTNNPERDEDINSYGDLTRWRDNLDPVWSPDGKKIAFGVDATHGRSGIYVMKPDGSKQTLVIAGGDQPDWSPDGSKIAYRREYAGQRNTDIYVANADGSNPVNLTAESAMDPASMFPPGHRTVPR